MLPGFCWSKTSELNKDIMRLTIPTSFRFLTVMIKSAVPSRIGRNYPFCFSMLASEASTCLLLLPYVLSHTSKNQIARSAAAAAAAKSLQSCPILWDPIEGSPPGSPIPGILQERTLEWVAISFSIAWKRKVKVKSLSRVRLLGPHGLQPSRLFRPWDFTGKSTGLGCHCLHHSKVWWPFIIFPQPSDYICNNFLWSYKLKKSL